MGDDTKSQDNPLYGAAPPATESGTAVVPHAAVASGPESRIPEHRTTNPLFGATPPAMASITPVSQLLYTLSV